MRLAPYFAFLLLSWQAPAHAANFCVDTGAELATALDTAASSSEDDVIRLETGPVTLAAELVETVRGNLSITGGYAAGCLLPAGSSSFSTINAAPGTAFRLNLRDGDLSTLRLRFAGFNGVTFSDAGFDSDIVSGEIRVQRTAFIGNGTGLRLGADHHNVRVENSLFTGSTTNAGIITQGAGLAIERTAKGTPIVAVQVINNTLSGNRFGFAIITEGPLTFVPVLGNNILFDNRVYDLVLRLPTRVEYSTWVTQDFTFGGSLAPNSFNNLSSNPQLDANFKPIEPGSPAINAGDSTPVGGLPGSDYDGGPRVVGTRVDRGAYESAVNNASVLTVTSTANSGAGTLRQAIIDANSSNGAKAIEFNIAGACPRQITLTSALPALTESISIEGYTQPGSVQNESARAFDGTLCVGLLGGGTVATGLDFRPEADEVITVAGLAFYGFTSEALKINGAGSGLVRGNAFGTGLAAFIGVPELGDAAIRVQDAPDTEIGGSDSASRNVISRAAGAGIRLEASTGGRSVRNNLIGFNTAGTAALPNGIGITVEGSDRDVITKNLVGFSTAQGIRVLASATPAQETVITDNEIGVSATFGAAGNGTNGIRIEGGNDHAVQFNDIRHNGTDGLVVLTASRRVDFTNNGISDNGQQAIDLSPDGVNPIDNDVGQTGANDQQNYPALAKAEGTAVSGTVTGTLASANGTYRIQFFRTIDCDANGYGEAGQWIGQTNVTITNAGAANGSVAFSGNVIAPSASNFGFDITAIATDSEGNSSEVSACVPYVPGPIVFEDGFE